MPRLLSAATIHEKNQLQSTHVLSLLLEAQIPGAPAPYRIANYDQDVVFHGLWFLKARFDVDALEDATSQALARLRLTVDNVNQEFLALLENYWQPGSRWDVLLWFPVDMSAPDETPYGTAEVFTGAQVSTDTVGAVVDLQAEGITLSGTLPKRRYTASSGFPYIPRRLT